MSDTASLRLMKFSLLLPTYEGKLLEYIVKRGNVDSAKTGIDSKTDDTYESLMNILTLYESDENDDTFLVFKSSILQVLIEFSIYLSTLIYNTTYDDLTADDGKHISQNYMQRINNSEVGLGLTYGEITLNSFAALLEYCPVEGKIFVDVGSGTGKALIAASLLFGSRLKHIHGIELVPGLYESSITSINKYYDIMTMQFPEIFTCLKGCKITAEEGDMLQYGKDNSNNNNDKNDNINDTDDITQKFDWTKADIVLANSTCFPSALMINLARCAEQMKKGF